MLCWAGLVQADIDWGYLPPPVIPADNPISAAKVQLGAQLFEDKRLSVNGTYSCASCHQPDRHFSDGLPLAVGVSGETLQFNTPTLYYTAFNASLGWTDKGLDTLEQQHMKPLFNTSPMEMGFSAERLASLAMDADYQHRFETAFSSADVTVERIIKALASYVRTLHPPPSAFDEYLFHDKQNALDNDAKAGMTLFFSAQLGCSQCHASLTFSGPISHVNEQAEPVFHRNGVSDSQLAFRAPTLRAIAHTAPYMHDGSLVTLAEVVDRYQNTSAERIPTFTLTADQEKQLIAFLKTL